jgi:hypothetical protein
MELLHLRRSEKQIKQRRKESKADGNLKMTRKENLGFPSNYLTAKEEDERKASANL